MFITEPLFNCSVPKNEECFCLTQVATLYRYCKNLLLCHVTFKNTSVARPKRIKQAFYPKHNLETICHRTTWFQSFISVHRCYLLMTETKLFVAVSVSSS